jgi:hypothetical protein
MIITVNLLYERLLANASTFHQVVDFDPMKDKLLHLDFSETNTELADIDLSDTKAFTLYVDEKLKKAKAKFGIGGYNEPRGLYSRSKVFDAVGSEEEPRRLHLGIDIWGEEGTKVYAPLGGMVHSYAFNKGFGNYGATLVLLHQLDTITFYTLYGHLSLDDIARVSEFQYIVRGTVIGHFGKPEENVHWPPHLHFQVIKDMRINKGDYPGVCKFSERKKYLANCPDPDAILGMMRYL